MSLFFALVFGTFTSGMAQQGWVVKPEWVRAHEEFLASDALAGRGSATRDEQIAAEYVASEFEAYGLKPAPGMPALIQTAEIVAPELDGKATLSVGAGGPVVEEGNDLRLLIPSGASAAGPIVRIAAAEAREAKVPRGAVVVLTGGATKGSTLFTAYQLRRSGASLVLFEEDEGLRAYLAKNPKPRMMMRLKEEAGDTTPLPATVASVTKAVMDGSPECPTTRL